MPFRAAWVMPISPANFRFFSCSSASFDPIHTYAGSTCRPGLALSNEHTHSEIDKWAVCQLGRQGGPKTASPLNFGRNLEIEDGPFRKSADGVSSLLFLKLSNGNKNAPIVTLLQVLRFSDGNKKRQRAYALSYFCFKVHGDAL